MNWLGKRRGSCGWSREGLRSLVEGNPAARSDEELLKGADADLREHVSRCPACRALLCDALEAGNLLRAAFAPAVAPDTFAARVMAEIRGREAQPAIGTYPWAAVQTLASRVAWVSALVLLVGSTWIYQRQAPRSSTTSGSETTADRFPEPAPQPSNLDEVLVSLTEAKP